MSYEKLKQKVVHRARGLCEYCKSPANISPQPFSIEHIIPRSKGGKTSYVNLALSCQGCNNHKYIKTNDIDLITNEQVPLFNPRKHIWEEHFRWSDDTLDCIGVTAIGRVTVRALQLNRYELRNLRKLLLSVGKHPPSI